MVKGTVLNNNIESVTDAENNATVYGYDARNLRVTETYPDAAPNTRVYTYDGANRLSSRLDQVNNLTQYIYDMANRLNTRSYPDSLNDTFGYDPASRLLSAVCARYNNTVTRSYDNAGRLTVETLTDAIIGSASVNYGYDTANRQTVITYPNGKQVVRGYTDRNRLSSVAYDGASVATFGYDLGMRRETTTFGNGRVETRAYRPDNLPVSQGIPTVTGFAYGWDANKRKTQQNDSIIPQNVQDYGYDDEDRLIDYTRTNGDTQTWGLTFEGDWNNTIINGVTENRTHNPVHELTARDASALSYDDKGNLTSNPSREQTYQWDYENRMRLLIKTGTDSYNYNYRYDALGRRVGWTRKNGTNPTGGGPTKTMAFVSAGMQEIAEYEHGTLKRIYVYGSYIDEPLMMMPIGGGPVKKYYYHANNLYSIAAITDKNGAVVERYNYNPYGEATILDPTGLIQQPASSIQNPVFFTGRRLDAETGLMYYRARYYDADLGRFVGRDPLGYVDGLNLYEYVIGNPLNLMDPTGREIAVPPMQDIPWLYPEQYNDYSFEPKDRSMDVLTEWTLQITIIVGNGKGGGESDTIKLPWAPVGWAMKEHGVSGGVRSGVACRREYVCTAICTTECCKKDKRVNIPLSDNNETSPDYKYVQGSIASFDRHPGIPNEPPQYKWANAKCIENVKIYEWRRSSCEKRAKEACNDFHAH